MNANQPGDRYASSGDDELRTIPDRIDVARKVPVCFPDVYDLFHGQNLYEVSLTSKLFFHAVLILHYPAS